VNKVSLLTRIPPRYEQFAFTAILRDVEQTISRGADAYLFRVTTTAVDYTANVGDSIILVTANLKAITLPAASQCKEKRFTVKNAGVGVLVTTIQATAGNIDNAASLATSLAYQSVDLVSDGANYWAI
jgi:hypothetical protein